MIIPGCRLGALASLRALLHTAGTMLADIDSSSALVSTLGRCEAICFLLARFVVNRLDEKNVPLGRRYHPRQ